MEPPLTYDPSPPSPAPAFAAYSLWRHPFKYLKHYWMPKTLLGRSLIILIVPVILVQAITTYVFIDRHWTKMTELLAEGIAGDISAVLTVMRNGSLPLDFSNVQEFAWTHFGLKVSWTPLTPKLTPSSLSERAWEEKFLHRALHQMISLPFQTYVGEEKITIKVATLKGELRFQLPTKRLFTRTTPLLLWWALGTPLLFLGIAILFMRNQVRPLSRLCRAVEDFGRGRLSKKLVPAGALEIRTVTQAFNNMSERIQRQITQRTEMLAGISHDLRTPLTRMKLQLALFKKNHKVEEMNQDLEQMEKMINEYLAFAKGEAVEKPQEIDLLELIQTLLENFPKHRLILETQGLAQPRLPLVVKEQALRRCLSNILENALRYGKKVWISVHLIPGKLLLTVEDNGPGIPKEAHQDVFRPFYRLDSARTMNTGNSGLGLSIAQDIVHAHGGQITLDKSQHKGLKVQITFPL